jgi:hypothetical protein
VVECRFFSAPMMANEVGRRPRQGSIVWGRREVAARIAGWSVPSHYPNAGTPASPDFLLTRTPSRMSLVHAQLRRDARLILACACGGSTQVALHAGQQLLRWERTRQRSLVAEHACARNTPHQYIPMNRAGCTARTKSDPCHYPLLRNAPGILRAYSGVCRGWLGGRARRYLICGHAAIGSEQSMRSRRNEVEDVQSAVASAGRAYIGHAIKGRFAVQ